MKMLKHEMAGEERGSSVASPSRNIDLFANWEGKRTRAPSFVRNVMTRKYGLAALFAGFWVVSLAAGFGEDILKLDYENGKINLPEINVGAGLPKAVDAIEVTKDYARTGVCSLRTKVAFTDDYISHGAHRAESDAMKLVPARYKPGDRRRYQFSVMLDKDWQVSKQGTVDIIWQFKRTSGGPDMFVAAKRGSIVLRHMDAQDVLVKAYKPGEWMDFRFDIAWSTGTNGLVECWVKTGNATEYAKVLTYSGPNIDVKRTDKGTFGYVKWGLYRPDAKDATDVTTARIVYHDDILISPLP